jgi:hypothetical protein
MHNTSHLPWLRSVLASPGLQCKRLLHDKTFVVVQIRLSTSDCNTALGDGQPNHEQRCNCSPRRGMPTGRLPFMIERLPAGCEEARPGKRESVTTSARAVISECTGHHVVLWHNRSARPRAVLPGDLES